MVKDFQVPTERCPCNRQAPNMVLTSSMYLIGEDLANEDQVFHASSVFVLAIRSGAKSRFHDPVHLGTRRQATSFL